MNRWDGVNPEDIERDHSRLIEERISQPERDELAARHYDGEMWWTARVKPTPLEQGLIAGMDLTYEAMEDEAA